MHDIFLRAIVHSYHIIMNKNWKKGRCCAMKQPFLTAEELKKITDCYPTPFYLYDEKGIRDNARKLTQAFAWNSGFQEYFAVKATPNPSILKMLKEEGCGVDCSSLTELMLAEQCGFSGSQIMFSSNDTPAEDYVYAHRLGATINLDDISHIPFLQECIGTLPKKMSVRYNPGGVFTLGKTRDGFQVMDQPGEAKFGMTKAQIFEALAQLKALGVEEFGIHAFVASNTLSNDYYPALAEMIFHLVVEVKEKMGISISFVNLSGGVGIPYHPEDTPNDIIAIGKGVQEKYDAILRPAGLDHIKMCSELGRFMLGPYGALITKVIHLKHTYKDYAGVDANACNLIRPAMYGAYHHISVIGKEGLPLDHIYDVTGNLCENNDKFAVNRPLPQLQIGDTLFIHDAGAHSFSMGYNYNGRLRSAEYMYHTDGTVEMIRRAETPEDYFATLKF